MKDPGKDSSKLREYLKNKLGLSWISFEEFTKEGSQIPIKTESNRVVIGKEGNLVVIESNGKIVQKLVMTNKGFVKDNVAPYNEMASLFYSSVEDLALLFLAPLLAIAIWFFLVQGGMEDGKYTLALAAFATGLVTDEIINSLTEFIRRVTGRVKENMNDSGGSSTTTDSGGSSTTTDSGGSSTTTDSGGSSTTTDSGGSSLRSDMRND